MNKGLTSYHKLRRAVIKRELCLFIATTCLIVSHVGSYALGRIQGFDRGMQYSNSQIKTLLEKEVEEGKNFFLQGINIKFYPRKDRGVNVAKVVLWDE